MAANAQHSKQTDDWGTPRPAVELARYVLTGDVNGTLDLDSCSSDYWNYHSVKARRFYSERDNVLEQHLAGRVLCNPPGGKVPGTERSLPKAVWEHHVDAWRRGQVDGIVWVGYSLEQLVVLQGSPAHPLQFWTLVPAGRLAFLQRTAGEPVQSSSPTHGNYLTLLHSQRSATEARAQAVRFRDFARRMGDCHGALVRPL